MPNTQLVNINNIRCTMPVSSNKLIHNSILQDTHMVLIIELKLKQLNGWTKLI